MPDDFLEKRKCSRFDFHLPMLYRRLETTPQEYKGSLTENISESGVRTSIHEFLPLNIKLVLEISMLSGVKPVEGTGRIAWIKKAGSSEQYDVGIEFIDLNQDDQNQISKFIFNKKIEKLP